MRLPRKTFALMVIMAMMITLAAPMGLAEISGGGGGEVAPYTNVSIDCPASVDKGDVFAIDVILSNVSDLYGAAFELAFDPELIQINSAYSNLFDSSQVDFVEFYMPVPDLTDTDPPIDTYNGYFEDVKDQVNSTGLFSFATLLLSEDNGITLDSSGKAIVSLQCQALNTGTVELLVTGDSANDTEIGVGTGYTKTTRIQLSDKDAQPIIYTTIDKSIAIEEVVTDVPVTGVFLEQSTLNLTTADNPVQLNATVEPTDATNQNVSWDSSDQTVATVVDGLVTPVGVGTTAITVSTDDGGYTDVCTVTVSLPVVEDPTVTIECPEYVNKGESFNIEVYVSDVYDLYGAAFELAFDPGLININSASSNLFDPALNYIDLYIVPDMTNLPTDPSTVTGPTSFEDVKSEVNSSGLFSFASFLLGEEDGISLDVNGKVMVSLQCQALNTGAVNILVTDDPANVTDIDFDLAKTARIQLSNSSAQAIAYTTADQSIVIGEIEPNALDVNPVVLPDTYTNAPMTLTEVEDTWAQGEALDVRVMLPNPSGPPTQEAGVDITNIVVNADTIDIVIPAGLGVGGYIVEVLRASDVIATGAFMVNTTITEGPEITTTSLPAATEGEVYSTTITAEGGTSPYAWSVVNGNLPIGVNINNATGVVSGIPGEYGQFTFTVGVTDTNSLGDIKTFSLYVEQQQTEPLTITTSSLTDATVGQSYSAALTASGGTSPCNWTLAAGSSLPAGLTLSTDGLLSGTPTESGQFTFTVEVQDNDSNLATQSLTLDVGPSSQGVTSIDIIGKNSITIPASGVAIEEYIAVDQDGENITEGVINWSLETLVTGVSVNESTGVVIVDATTTEDSFTLAATLSTDSSVLDSQIISLSSANVEDAIIPQLVFDKTGYTPGGMVELDLVLTNLPTGAKTNSVTFEIEYDSNTFELATGNPDNDILDGYINFTVKNDLEGDSNSTRKVKAMLTDLADTSLQDGQSVMTVCLKVKDGATFGKKIFKLNPVAMLDSENTIYNVNNDQAVYALAEIANHAVIEGYVTIFLGDNGSQFNTYLLSQLDQDKLNSSFSNMLFTLKQNSSDTGTAIKGADVFEKDINGNIAVLDETNNQVKGYFRLNASDLTDSLLTISGAGYLARDMEISLNAGQVFSVGSATAPVELYPGDLAKIANSALVLEPDGNINNIDFSAWLKTYKDNLASLAEETDVLNADFTKDGTVNNVDFSLWLASYKKALGM